ncbi:uncharacterized protein METZ01_LOCUS229148, partial [marine metagenome]
MYLENKNINNNNPIMKNNVTYIWS